MEIAPTFLDNPNLQFVMMHLNAYNHKAFIVGGCVRDAVIGVPVNDIDIATDMTPDVVRAVFKDQPNVRLVPTGIEHGTWTLVVGEDSFEVTTYRRDVTTDGRRATVEFAATIQEDATRRDFTMNALYTDAKGIVSDPTGRGIPDLMMRTVRFVGDADERCREDYLRILRLFRFHAHYGVGALDSTAFEAARNNAAGLKNISGERIWAELKKTLSAHNPTETLFSMEASGVLDVILPTHGDVLSVAEVVQAERTAGLKPRWQRRFAALLWASHEIPFPATNVERRYIETLVKHKKWGAAPAQVAYLTRSEDAAVDCYLLACAEGRIPCTPSMEEIYRGLNAQCPVTAEFLQKNGYEPGKKLGDALRSASKLFQQSGLKADRKTIMDQLSPTITSDS